MNSPADRTNVNPAKVQAALLEYFEAPGRFQLSLRQPALLFSSIREILQLAAGRSAGVAQPENQAVMEAAAFFLRAALLYPGATHYAVMGLPTRTAPVELKERYRLLMRLIHPDFATAHAQTWPGDAAVRVNRAYEVLSSPVLRAEYDEQLATAGSARPPVPAKRDSKVPAPAMPKETASWRFNRVAVWMLVGCGGLLGVASLIPWQDPEQLVQKLEAPLLAAEPRRVTSEAIAQTVAAVSEPAEPAPLALPPPPAAVPAPPPVQPPAPVHAPAAAAVHAPAPSPAPAPARMVAAAPVPLPVPRAEPPIQLRASASVPALRPQAAPAQRPAPPLAVAAASEAPRLAAATQLSPPEPTRQPERRVEAIVPAPVAPAPAPVAVTVAAVREEPARPVPVVAQMRSEVAPGPTGTEPSLNDAQPLLTQLLQSMEGGSGEHILRLLEADARRNPAALALSRQYDQLVGRARPVRLSHVEFRSEAREGVLLVTGRVRLHAGDPTIGATGERMSLRAEFVSRGGKVLLTGLSTGSD